MPHSAYTGISGAYVRELFRGRGAGWGEDDINSCWRKGEPIIRIRKGRTGRKLMVFK